MMTTTKQFITVLFLFTFSNFIIAQDCFLPQAQTELKGNNISANILLGGDLFWDRSDAAFNINSPTIPIHTIYTAGLWLGGFSGLPNNPSLKLAGADYNSNSKSDYSAGPLDDSGLTTMNNCQNFDRLWEVFGSEIEQHLTDFNDNGNIDNPISNIYAYPGNQNPHFESNNGFALPSTPQGFAPFWDNDADGIYNPDNGDYPLPSAVDKDHYPSHLIWGVFNDSGKIHTSTQGEPIRAEIQLTAWAHNCTDNELINNTIFTSHKIINKGADLIDTLHAGIFVDFDLGCFVDDYIGSIPDLNTFYAYNSDPVDGANTGATCVGGINTFANLPPVQSVTYLNMDMNSFGTTSPAGLSSGPQLPADYYNLLTGSWTDGSPFTASGNGYNSGGQTTNFLFSDNPNDPNGWSMATDNLPDGDFRTISSVNMGSLQPQQSATMDMAYTFHSDNNLNHIETVNLVYDNTPVIQQIYDSQFSTVCSPIMLNNDDLVKDNILFFPNPALDFLNIKFENPTEANLSVFDVYGKKVVAERNMVETKIQLPIEHLSQGVYFLRIETKNGKLIKKFLKI